MKKFKSIRSGVPEPEIPAAVMHKLRQAYQAPAGSALPCPTPEQVAGCALEELEAQEHQEVQAHLLQCRDCLELYLDVRLARAEAEKLMETPLETPQKAGWLAAFGSKVRESLRVLVKPRRLIPALAAVSLVLLVFILGREETSRVLPPSQLAMKQPPAPAAPPGAAPPQELAEAKPSEKLPDQRLRAYKQKFKTAAPALERNVASRAALPESGAIRLELAETPAPAGGSRLSYRVDRDAFAYLLGQEKSGKIRLLFSGNLEGGKTYLYPQTGQRLRLDSATGQATVFLLAAEKPVVDLDTKIRLLEHAGEQQVQSLFPGSTVQSLTVKLP
jgi:hypothetical protein